MEGFESLDEWSSDANEAIAITLVAPTTTPDEPSEEIATFHPKFTYPLFGDSESIYGYKGLEVKILFAADDMSSCVDVRWAEKAKTVNEVAAEDIPKVLQEHLPEEAFKQDIAAFKSQLQLRDPTLFRPPGTVITTYTTNSKTYEIYHDTLSSPPCAALLRKIQLLILLYIEGGSMIDPEDEPWSNDRWDVFFLYERTPAGTYSFIGYSTLYRYYYFSTSAAKDANLSRIRLSQFLILPPYQRKGHGGRFYEELISHLVSDSSIQEITVEDPSEEFCDLRDTRDLRRLQQDPDFRALSIPAIITARQTAKSFMATDIAISLRKTHKMPERQFSRCLEMDLLRKLDKNDKRTCKAYRLLVKGRIYKQNRDVLAQLDRLDRIDKLEQTYITVEDDYQRILNGITQELVEVDAEKKKNIGKGKGKERMSTTMDLTSENPTSTKRVKF